MNASVIEKIFADTAYIRTGGSDAERTAAQYIADHCAALGLQARLDPFVVDMATINEATLPVIDADGSERSIPCKGYLCAGSGDVEAPRY